jgi:hypothetical protein
MGSSGAGEEARGTTQDWSKGQIGFPVGSATEAGLTFDEVYRKLVTEHTGAYRTPYAKKIANGSITYRWSDSPITREYLEELRNEEWTILI